MTVRDQLASLVRTYVPVGVGFVLTLLARKFDVVLDGDSSAVLVTGVAALVTAVYYGVARFLEIRWKWAGWLLGLAVTPQYIPGRPSDPYVPKTPESGADGRAL